MKNKVFQKAPVKKRNQNSTVGGRYQTRYDYINGYYEAAKELVKIALDEEVGTFKKDVLFYPICFNYRHYLELFLKSLIIESEILYDKTDRLGYLKNGTLDKKVSDILHKKDIGHSLEKLISLFIERLKLVDDEPFPTKIKDYIIEIHNMDTDGEKFRYDIIQNKKLCFPDRAEYDLKNISDKMEKVHSLLCACDSSIDNDIKQSDAEIEEWENSIDYDIR